MKNNKILMLSLFIILTYFLFVRPINTTGKTEKKKPELNVNDKVTVRG